MRKSITIIIPLSIMAFSMALGVVSPSLASIPAALADKGTPTLATMLETVTPAVVNIAVEKEASQAPAKAPKSEEQQQQNPKFNAEAVGSGVIFDEKNGLIVTNAHVVQHQHIIIVTLKDQRRFRANLIGKDDGFDIAIIKIPPINLRSIPFGDSDLLKVGDFVAAIGSPFGFTQTVTSGVISALNREEPQIEGFQSFIQTDAPINPGNSGGALVNLQGDLIGINTAMFTPTYGSIGIGFAIPSNMVQSVIEQLLKYGRVERGFLGVIAQDISPELAEALDIKPVRGVLVTQVVGGSAAEKAGFKVGDIIEKLNERVIRSSAQLRNTLGLMRPGTKISVAIIRNHKPLTMAATVGNPNAEIKGGQSLPFLTGMRLQNFNELQSDGSILNGVIVAAVSDISPGALAGLQPGDVITEANSKPIQSLDQLKQLALQNPKHILLKVNRNEGSLFLVVQPGEVEQ